MLYINNNYIIIKMNILLNLLDLTNVSYSINHTNSIKDYTNFNIVNTNANVLMLLNTLLQILNNYTFNSLVINTYKSNIKDSSLNLLV